MQKKGRVEKPFDFPIEQFLRCSHPLIFVAPIATCFTKQFPCFPVVRRDFSIAPRGIHSCPIGSCSELLSFSQFPVCVGLIPLFFGTIIWLVVWNIFIFPYVGTFIFFSEGLKPPNGHDFGF